jgi:hypothetical protein
MSTVELTPNLRRLVDQAGGRSMRIEDAEDHVK